VGVHPEEVAAAAAEGSLGEEEATSDLTPWESAETGAEAAR
jgi:hypothetical protein